MSALNILLWLWYCLLPIIPLLPLVLLGHRLYASRSQHKHHFKTAAPCRYILNGSQYVDTRKNIHSPQTARAIPNRTLQRVFGIENSFTTGDEDEARFLVHNVKALIAESEAVRYWEEVMQALYRVVLAIMHVEEGKNDTVAEGDRIRLMLAPMVRALTLRVLLFVFMGMKGASSIGLEQLDQLAQALHSTRMGMDKAEDTEDQEMPELNDNHELWDALINALAGNPGDPRSNPLTVLLHPFESLWPVIMRLFMTIHCQGYHSDKDSWKAAFAAFIKEPTLKQFRLGRTQNVKDTVTVEHLVKEALRLYPSIPQVKRAFKLPTNRFCFEEFEYLTATADFEACHLDTKIWGRDAAEFKPSRWEKVSVVQNLSFLPFGSLPFLCPAADEGLDFGLRLIGLVVGLLVDVFGNGEDEDLECLLDSNDEQEVLDMVRIREQKKLSNDLGCYEGVYVEYAWTEEPF
ncbi:uncharacterized protein DSM5745_06320 [Aspergillus mulundensis]|uniref:Cytochrome P450 n=1 Tax=Aspergillus mulundensis TaxID=1810919 RepID=A0A3D8RQV2_9EURO|nr:hypothetical protein DSM5745_06320 [Aspergillus mulundensis]RDW76328.1 hypothetical protein DSM5745_06320 [Aspergillus mulundensis]